MVRHHFGSKQALREACDRYALDRLMRIKESAVVEGRLADPGFLSAHHPAMLALYRYFARALLDGSAAAAAMFDEMVTLTERWLAEHNPGLARDPRAYAAVRIASLEKKPARGGRPAIASVAIHMRTNVTGRCRRPFRPADFGSSWPSRARRR